jgi:hypothetical protein
MQLPSLNLRIEYSILCCKTLAVWHTAALAAGPVLKKKAGFAVAVSFVQWWIGHERAIKLKWAQWLIEWAPSWQGLHLQIVRKGSKALKCKFKPDICSDHDFERDSGYLNRRTIASALNPVAFQGLYCIPLEFLETCSNWSKCCVQQLQSNLSQPWTLVPSCWPAEVTKE